MFCHRIAIMIDGAFFLKRLYSFRQHLRPVSFYSFNSKDLLQAERAGEAVATLIQSYTVRHCWQKTERRGVRKNIDLYRIFFYDCPPIVKRMHFPVSGRHINFAETPEAKFRNSLHKGLMKKRKFALRLGHLADTASWRIRGNSKAGVQGNILRKPSRTLTDEDFELDTRQKGVDMRLGIDIASLAYKKLVSQIVLIAGDSDFVPVAKLARREGIDVIIDSLGNHIHEMLLEHIDGYQSHWHSLC